MTDQILLVHTNKHSNSFKVTILQKYNVLKFDCKQARYLEFGRIVSYTTGLLSLHIEMS